MRERQQPMKASEWCLFISLYTTQSLGIGFLVVALVAILRSKGGSFEMLSMVYALGLVWPFKFLWASWVDRISFGRLGHYRAWLIFMQTGMILVFASLMLFDVLKDFWWVYGLCSLLALFSATQDIAVDATACRRLSWQDRGIGNGIQISGGLLGDLLGAGVVLVAYSWIGWHSCLIILMMITSISLIQLMFYTESGGDIKHETGWVVLRQIKRLWKSPGGKYWLSILMVYPIGSSLAYSLITPMLVDQGWTLEKIGWSVNVAGSALGVLSALLAGWLIKKVTRRKALVFAALFQLPGVIAIGFLVNGVSDSVSVTIAVGVYFICYNPAATVLATFMMDRVAQESGSPGSEYTMQYSINLFFSMGVISVGTAFVGMIGYVGVLYLALAMTVLAILLVLPYKLVDAPE
ncbi:MFS transporter [Marinomonas rhizomae]|nr:MFS transporter [Marinomonas rhizomae]RNF68998.1 MFS transporter [Marinomonas rhizomae]